MAYTPIGTGFPPWNNSLGSLGTDSLRSSMPSGLPSASGQFSGQLQHSGVGCLTSRLDQQLSCAICLERYDEPRVLKCFHSFCRRCLVGVVERGVEDPDSPDRASRLTCPKCRDVTVLTMAGVDALPINWDLMGVVGIIEDEDDPPFPPSRGSMPSHVNQPSHTASSLQEHMCPTHHRLLDFLCEECNVLMCAACAVNTSCKHKQQIKDAKEVTCETRSQCYDPLEIRFGRLTVAIDDNTRMSTQLRKKAEEHKHHIRTLFQEARNALTSRELALVHAVDGIVNKKITALQTQCVELQQLRTKIRVEQDNVSRLLNITNNDYNVLLKRREIVAQVNSIITEVDEKDRDPVENIREGPECNLREELVEEAHSFGEVYCTPCPQKFQGCGAGLEKAFVGREAEFAVEAYDKYGQRAFKGGNTIRVQILDPQGAEVPVTVTSVKRGRYVVKYTPTSLGFHLVSIFADSLKISNHQTNIVVYGSRDYSVLSWPRTVLSRRHVPDMSTVRSACVMGGTGQIVFSDQLCLRVITTDGRLVQRAIGQFGTGSGQFNMPVGLASNNRDEIFVADCQNHRIQKLTPTGKYILSFGGHGNKAGSLSHPEAVAVTTDRLFVVDTGNHRVQVFHQRTGRFQGILGTKGFSGDLQLSDPQGVAVDEVRGRLFVTDSGTCSLHCLSLTSLQPVPEFGQSGVASLSCPSSVAVDRDGFVLVTSTQLHLLIVLSPQGSKVKQLGLEGTLFKTPSGICVDTSGNVVVVDTAVPCINIF